MEMPKISKKKSSENDTAVMEQPENKQSSNGAPPMNGTRPADGPPPAAVAQPAPDGALDMKSFPTPAAMELLAEEVHPEIAPVSLKRMPNGAELSGPLADGAKSFKGTFAQAGVGKEKLLEWFSLMDLGRITDTAASNYLKKAMGWSYHAPCAGHEGIQLAIGVSFRQKKDYLFPYYRDLMTCLAAGLTVEEIVLNGLSKDTDIAGGGRHMSNHFAKLEFNIETHSSLTNN